MTRRADYCPVGNEPCQSLCETPCSTRKPLTVEQIKACEREATAPFRTGEVWQPHQVRFVRAIERAHGIAPAGGIGGEINGDWYCEDHPQHLMGHNGCMGAGIIESARIPMLSRLLKIAQQQAREANQMRDDVVAQVRRSKKGDAP